MTTHQRSRGRTKWATGVERTAADAVTVDGAALSGGNLMTANTARIQLSGQAGNDVLIQAPAAHTDRADPGTTDDEDHICRGEN